MGKSSPSTAQPRQILARAKSSDSIKQLLRIFGADQDKSVIALRLANEASLSKSERRPERYHSKFLGENVPHDDILNRCKGNSHPLKWPDKNCNLIWFYLVGDGDVVEQRTKSQHHNKIDQHKNAPTGLKMNFVYLVKHNAFRRITNLPLTKPAAPAMWQL